MSDAFDEGVDAAQSTPLTQNMRDLLAEHGFGADFFNGLDANEEDAIAECPYEGEDSEREDDWKSGYARGMENRA